jgi:DNA-directed RNA polymerase subunit RPC12/RpoP
MPRPGFPFVVYALRRALAAKRPYRCPDCGTPVLTS